MNSLIPCSAECAKQRLLFNFELFSNYRGSLTFVGRIDPDFPPSAFRERTTIRDGPQDRAWEPITLNHPGP